MDWGGRRQGRESQQTQLGYWFLLKTSLQGTGRNRETPKMHLEYQRHPPICPLPPKDWFIPHPTPRANPPSPS